MNAAGGDRAPDTARIGRWMQRLARTVRILEQGAGPLVDLVARLWLAQAFLVSGLVKLANWDSALYLATHEYPVDWLEPATTACVGVAIEVGGALLLAAGLGTRLAALALLLLSLVIQWHYRALDLHLLWAALCAWLACRGAGPLSLDAHVGAGLANAPIPLAGSLARRFAGLTRHGLPVLLLLLRLWLGVSLLAAAHVSVFGDWTGNASWLPVTTAMALPALPAALVAGLLALGLGGRLVGLTLLVATATLSMLDAGTGAGMGWMLLHAILAAFGPGDLSVDAWLHARCRRIFPELSGRPAFSLDGLPHVVIVGAGFGGLACARALAMARARVTLIDRHNYHLFQPLLYQVATAGLSPGDIAQPVRAVLRDQFNARVLLGEVTGIDPGRRCVRTTSGDVGYDFLVLATGASHGYFGRDAWAAHAPGLKQVEDAIRIRARLLTAFERAEATDDDAERRALLTFLVVGGGPTGVELAGAIAELARDGMARDFRRFDPATAQVLLVQAGPRVLPTFPPALSEAAKAALGRLGVEVRLESRVESIDADGVTVNGQRIAARTVLWAAGVVASPAAAWLGAGADGAGRVVVGPDLTVPGFPEVYAIGDTAMAKAWKGNPVPGLAPAAKQSGAYVASHIAARLRGEEPPPAFRYRHPGSLATIGRKAAVADFGRVRLRGAVAWWLWGVVHVGFLAGMRNRLSVAFDWCWAYLTFRSGVRLITGQPDQPGAAAREAAQRAAA